MCENRHHRREAPCEGRTKETFHGQGGKGPFSRKKPRSNLLCLLVPSFISADDFRAPERPGPFRARPTGPNAEFPADGRAPKKGTRQWQVSARFCPKSDPKSWKALRFLQKRRWNWTFLGLVRGKEFIPRNGPAVSVFTFLGVSPACRAPRNRTPRLGKRTACK